MRKLKNLGGNYVLSLDVETYNGFQYPIIYDLGYCILDSNTLKIEKKVSTLITETYQLDAFSDSIYYSAKDERYKKLIDNEEIDFTTYEQALQELKQDIEQYNIKGIYAYNNIHEKKSFRATTALLLPTWAAWVKNLTWYDAMDYIGCLTDSTRYKEWAETNDKITASRVYISTKLEHVYQYTFGDLHFIENHTGYDDSYRTLQLLYQVGIEHNLQWYGEYKAKRFIKRDIDYKIKTIHLPDDTKKFIKYHTMLASDDSIWFTWEE